MITFDKLGKNVTFLKKYFEQSEISFCDISVGTKFMWWDDFVIDYAIFNDTLIMKESCPDYKDAFYYPMGKDVDGALSEIEKYCKSFGKQLRFCCIDNRHAAELTYRYPLSSVSNDRNWSDYIYDAEEFKAFSGKKFSGQRNHINKFKKLYPDFTVRQISKEDFSAIKTFLNEYERGKISSLWSEIEEERKVFETVENMFSLGLFGALISVNQKIVAISIGEIVKDTLVVHIEKGLTSYEGVYPTMANEFAKLFADSSVRFINREEDCGDEGLRISKLQYHPVEVKEKNFITVKTPFDFIDQTVVINTDRLSITQINEGDKEIYSKIFLDDNLNKYYGYDYREDLNGNTPSPQYFYSFMTGLREKREEFSFAVRREGVMIGELVLYNFTFKGELELGFRFLDEFQGKGYAFESTKAIIDYAFGELNVKKIFVRAKIPNLKSIKLIEKLSFEKLTQKDGEMFFQRLK